MTPSDDHRAERSLLLTVNACIVLALSVAAVVGGLGVVVRVSSVSPFAFLGAVLFVPAFVVFGLLVFYAVFHRKRTAAMVASAMFFIGSALSALGLVTNMVEAFTDDGGVNLQFAVTLGCIGLAVVCYGFFCGWLWLRWGRCLARSGVEGEQG